MSTPPADAISEPATVAPSRVRAVAARARIVAWAHIVAWWAGTALAGALITAILVLPGRLDQPTLAGLLRIPIEGLVGLALLLVVRGRVRTVVAAVLGVALGLWGAVRVVDVGFYRVLDRPFDPVHDWGFLESGLVVIGKSTGSAGTRVTVAVAVVAAVLLVVLVTLSVLRLTGVAARHRTGSTRAVAVLGLVWVVCAAAGAQLVADGPIASRDYLVRLGQVRASLWDWATFASQLADDPYRDIPGEELLTALRGKDVVVVLVESYGRAAVEHPEIGPRIGPVLENGTNRLAAAGFSARSAFLTSPTAGGGSWLAQATLLSGAWVDNQLRYADVAASDRLTLPGAFQRAGWRTVGIMPGITLDWPEGRFYAFDEIRTFQDLDYEGPIYSFDTIPDQYVLSYFERTERAPAPREPVMAVIPLISSHAPWTPVPALLDWGAIGDGSSYEAPAVALQPAETVLQADPGRVRADYANAIAYSLNAIVSYVEEYGDDDLVLVFLGDHQPVPVVTGEGAGRDAPISIVTRDRTVLDRIAGWGWQDGLRPDVDAPVWRMDSVRDEFLATFR